MRFMHRRRDICRPTFGLDCTRHYGTGLRFGRDRSHGLSFMRKCRFSFRLRLGNGVSFRYCFWGRRSLCRGFDMRGFNMCGLGYGLG
jgi:hypothetical protein